MTNSTSMARQVVPLADCPASSDLLQTVLLTGASEGMGKSVAIKLAKKGANIIIVARNVGKLEEALGQIKVHPLTSLPMRPTTKADHHRSRQLPQTRPKDSST